MVMQLVSVTARKDAKVFGKTPPMCRFHEILCGGFISGQLHEGNLQLDFVFF